MPATITATPDAETRLPTRADGTPWPMLLIHGDRITGANTVAELLAVLIPGYGDLPDDDAGNDDALWRRYESAIATAGELQETLLAAVAENGDFHARTAGEEVLTALLAAKSTPYTGPAWRQTVPLVLIDTDYQPFTARPRPDGRIIYLRPAQEHDYLASLTEAGLVHYRVDDREQAVTG
jgi:hypothetical protein